MKNPFEENERERPARQRKPASRRRAAAGRATVRRRHPVRPRSRPRFPQRFPIFTYPAWPGLQFPEPTPAPAEDPDTQEPRPDDSAQDVMDATQSETGPGVRGSRYVRHVQRRLNQLLGLRLPLDGKLGVMTRAAIRSLQRKNRLPADGIIRPQTARILSAASRRRIHTDEELDSEIDRNSYEYGLWVQRSLNRIMGSGLVEDGIIGTHTRSAIRDFQQRYGLLVDGIVGPQTEGALIKAGAAPPTGDETGAPAGSIPTTPKGKVLSGSYWVGQFRGSTSVDDLSSPFRENVRKFLAALTEAGAKYKISSTYRDPKRQYLMYWAKKIADGADPRSAASFPGVNIEWWHGSEEASRQAAQQMVDDFHIGGNPVGLVSRHTERKAIDMDISWSGSLRIRNVKGQYITITSAPRDGTNLDLGEVGRSYNVIHYDKDRPHWSIDGH